MGKHSDNDGLFGRKGTGGGSGGRRPIRRKSVKSAAGTGRSESGTLGGKRQPVKQSRGRRPASLEAAPLRLRAERDRRRQRAKRIAMMVGASALALLFVAIAGVFVYARYLENTMRRTVYQEERLALNLKKAEPQKPFNMLLLGFDKRAKDKVYRSDTIILARIDPKSKQAWLLSIPRDTKVQVPGHGTRKVNEAFALGQEELAIETVEKFAGVPIHHYMGVNFKGFHKAVDAMGGIWVDVPVEIDDRQADSTPDKRASHIDPGYQLLDGEHALTFVRTRKTFADQDFGRMRNQQAFFLAMADQAANRTPVAKLPGIVAAVVPYISTDMSLVELMRVAQVLQSAGSKRIHTETIGGTWRSPYVVTDEELKTELLAKFEAGEPFKEPEPSEEGSGTASTSKTTDAESTPVKSASDIKVTIRNGAGVAGCAKQASSVLKARAFKILEVGNAGQFVYDTTLVVHRNDRAAAEKVASALPPGSKIVESRGMYSFEGDVLVVVGKDWDIARVPVTPVITQ